MAKRIIDITHYGMVEALGTTDVKLLLTASVTFERDLGEEYKDSERLMFVKPNIILGLFALGEKAVFYLDISSIENVETCPDGNLKMTCNNKDTITISFKDEKKTQYFLDRINKIRFPE